MSSLLRYLKARELELNLQVRKVQDILHRKVKRRGEEKIPIIRVEHQELDLRQEQTQTVQQIRITAIRKIFYRFRIP